MSDIAWTPVTVKLRDLKPWADNPRQSSKAQARRILKSFDDFGQVHPVAVGPGLEVYDGHQRLSALLTVHGPDYEIDARQSSRPLTDDERRRLVLALHAGAVGSWDWDTLAGWDAPTLIHAFEEYQDSARRDLAAINELLSSEMKLEEETDILRPKHYMRVLVSVPIDFAADVKDALEKIASVPGIEIDYGAN